MGNTIDVEGRNYAVADIHRIGDIQPQLAAHMKARGFDAYGFVTFPRGRKGAVAYRASETGCWHIVGRA